MISSDNTSDLESTDGPSFIDNSSSDDIMRTYLNTCFPSQEVKRLKLLGHHLKKELRTWVANGKTWDSILNKTFGVKKPTAGTGAEQEKGKRKIRSGS
nr:hypothetical protein [Tanacetum cinerariifolium]